MKNEANEKSYTNDDLKITRADTLNRIALETVEPEIENEEISTKECIKVSLFVLVGYGMFSLIPTLIFTQLVGTGFLVTQAVILLITLVIVFGFGLHKEASPEQLVKRDMNRRK